MTNSHNTTGGLAVILVAYHLSDAGAAFALIHDFCQKLQKSCSHAVVVDNGGAMTTWVDNDGNRRVISGDNIAWEFSGWLCGMEAICGAEAPVVALINDSYGRNWSLSSLSLAYMRRMYRAACNGRVAAWLDNFSHLHQPRFSRRPNSRIVFVSAAALIPLSLSLHQAIRALRELTVAGNPLFTPAEQACLDRWTVSQPGRWAPQTLRNRAERIFLEHHMFDALEPGLLQCFPRTWLGSLVYGVGRRLLRERR